MSTAQGWSKINVVATMYVIQGGGESHFIPGVIFQGGGWGAGNLEAGLQKCPWLPSSISYSLPYPLPGRQ